MLFGFKYASFLRVMLFLFVFCIPQLKAQYRYDAALIDDTLKYGADAVIRTFDTEFIVHDIGSATRKVHYAVTILNKQGEDFGIFNEVYHKFLKINAVSGNIYDANGRLIRELKKNDFNDVSAISGFSLYEDNRRKYVSPITNFFPYTVEYSYEMEYKGLFYYPTWYPINSYNLSLENASLVVELPDNLSFFFKEQSFENHEPDVVHTNNSIQYTWQIDSLHAYREEPYSPDLSRIVPAIYLAPEAFEIDGYPGKLDSWTSFGLWVKQLNEGKNNLSKRSKADVEEIIQKSKDTLQIIKDVYHYVQSKTRYVNIKLGIGGYQPFDAELVHNVGYGDCKALTNYTKSLLELAGIRSYYTLVRAGKDAPDIQVDFPSPQFNHAFLCVPYKQDTIWLECTSQTAPFNYIGDFTDNRHVLLITDEGGKITRTPANETDYNQKRTFAELIIDREGNAQGSFTLFYQGNFYDNLSELANRSSAEQKDWFYENLNFPSFRVEDFTINNNKEDSIPSIEIELELSMEKFAGTSNKRLFIPVNIFPTEVEYYSEKMIKERRYPIVIQESKTENNQLRIAFPNGYDVEYLPVNQNLANDLGTISAVYAIDGNTLFVSKRFTQNYGTYTPDRFAEWNEILELKRSIGKMKVVLVKRKTSETVSE